MDNDISEIDKLTERIARDPKSKLFVPLAEEYKKRGDIEMSIHVLTEGLKNNPGYVTAKSFLGRLLLEKGDLPAAQKEFGEVVKAIPDNLLAQRKLGDIYALQGHSVQALEHYNLARSLNPADEEIAALISDLEAGRSVKDRLERQQPQQAAEQRVKDKATSGPHAGVGASHHAPSHPGEATEEPEDVHVVEPLESIPESAGRPDGFDFLNESTEPQQAPEEGRGGLFEPTTSHETGEVPVASVPENSSEAEAAVIKEDQSSRKPDDFTTNTLAELYIAQGFYEKAIDIYERMLADNPESRALQEKLSHVRGLAGQPENAGGPVAGPVSAPVAPFVPDQGAAPIEGSDLQTATDLVPPMTGITAKEEFPVPDFEPRAYRPPVEVSKPEISPAVNAETQPSEADKKETIDRLELWLKNVMKEKQK